MQTRLERNGMRLNMVTVHAAVLDQRGNPVSGGKVSMRLVGTDRVGQTFVAPKETLAVTDANGEANLNVFPNTDGSERTLYAVTIRDDRGRVIVVGTCRVPDSDCNLMDILDMGGCGCGYEGPVIVRGIDGASVVGASISDNNELILTTAEPSSRPIATATVLGAVKVGQGLSIDENGVLSVLGS